MSDPFDPGALADLLAATGDDPDVVGELVDAFLADTPRQLDAMRRAVEADSADDLVRPATLLSGAAQGLGAVGLAELCRQVQELARRGATLEAAARLDDAEIAYREAAAALEEARQDGWDTE